MEKSEQTKQLLQFYYAGFAAKDGWESALSEDFEYTGGDMNHTTPVTGKQAYIEIIKRFAQRFEAMRVKEMIVDGEKAIVIGNYDFSFPNGKK